MTMWMSIVTMRARWPHESGVRTRRSCIRCYNQFIFWIVGRGNLYTLSNRHGLATNHVALFFGGFTSVCLSYRSRYMAYLRRQADVLKRVHFEICRHNDELTCLTLQPKENAIVVDIFYKSHDPVEKSSNAVSS